MDVALVYAAGSVLISTAARLDPWVGETKVCRSPFAALVIDDRAAETRVMENRWLDVVGGELITFAKFRGVEPGAALVIFSGGVEVGRWGGIADVNVDGFVDAIDYDVFVAWFLTADARADVNGDGFVDATDLDAFVAAWVK